MRPSSIGVQDIPVRTTEDFSARPVHAIFWAGTASGVLDITAAFVTWGVQGVSPFRLLRAIASGLLGPEALSGGWQTSLLGAFFHFLIAFSAAAVFYAASRRMKFLAQHAGLSGIAYGVAVYLVMYWIVIPLSRLHPTPFSISRTMLAIVTHMVCVGLPISLVVRKFSN